MTTEPLDDVPHSEEIGSNGNDADISADILGGGEFLLEDRLVGITVDHCIEGGWETSTDDGRSWETDGTFHYSVVLEFESKEKADQFLDSDDFDVMRNTMVATVKELSSDTLRWERGWDSDPDAYDDGVIPDKPEDGFSNFSFEGFDDYILPEFVDIISATYPDIGLVGAFVTDDSGSETPGCFQGIPSHLANGTSDPQVIKDEETVHFTTGVSTMKM